jgi:hypothetical protein
LQEDSKEVVELKFDAGEYRRMYNEYFFKWKALVDKIFPLKVQIGLNTWIREIDDPEYYNVNGRSYFERLHYTKFPEREWQEALNELRKENLK